MIQSKRINGIDVKCVIADPSADTIYAAAQTGATVKQLAQRENADVAANFNYALTTVGIPIGRLIADGKVVTSDIEKTTVRDEIYMLSDKSLHIGKAPKDAVWAMQGSPRLLRDGKNVVSESIKRDQLGKDIWTGKAYRLAVGLTADRKLVIVRTLSTVTLDALAAIMAALGCVDALNGDGGGSAYLWPSDNSSGRKMGAALIVKKGEGKVSRLIGDSKPELVIDAGHGGSDPGASGNGIVEKQMTLDISLYQYARFKALGVKVALTRDSEISLDSNARSAIVKNSGAKYCISNHINSADATTAAGVETIHSIHSDGKLATALANSIKDAGQVFRRVLCRANNDKATDYYYMHRLTGNVSTVIVEYGFCSNAADAARLKANWQDYAEAVVRAYCQFVGHRYEAPVKPVEPVGGFVDVKGHWAEASIQKAIKAGVMNGVAANRFAPDEPLTRAQIAVLFDRLGLLDKEVK